MIRAPLCVSEPTFRSPDTKENHDSALQSHDHRVHRPGRDGPFLSRPARGRRGPVWGLFVNVQIGDGVPLQFAAAPISFPPQLYVYLLDDHFDQTYAQFMVSGRERWADPQRSRARKLNHEHGGRGVYLLDPSGHNIELMTQPYV